MGYESLMSQVDTVVLGRKTYETVLGFLSKGIPWPYETKKVVVMTRNADFGPLVHGAVRWSSSITDLLGELERESRTMVYIDGGELVQSAIRQNLVDNLIITFVPVMIGSGRRLFDEGVVEVDRTWSKGEPPRTANCGAMQVHWVQ